jgi:Flp pilus assembly protein TadG
LYSLIGWTGRFARSLARDRRGSVYVFVGVAIIPMLAAMGIAVDGARGYLVRSRLSQALDAAGLAGARVFDSASRDSDVRMYFNANFPSTSYQASLTPNPSPNISANASAGTLTLTATATIPTTFMRVVGINTLTVHAETTITRLNREMELVLAMDNTGSMDDDGKMEAAQAAATNLLDILYGSRDTIDRFNVSVVPFVSSVNVGTQYTSWAAVRPSPAHVITQMERLQTSGYSPLAPSVVRVRLRLNAGELNHGLQNGDIVTLSGVCESQANSTACQYYNRPQLITVDQTLYGYNNSQLTRNSTAWPSSTWNNNTDFTFRVPIPSTNTPPAAPTITAQTATARLEMTVPSWYSWQGCVEARQDPYEEEQADATPTTAGVRQFTRYFWQSTDRVRLVQRNATSTSQYANWSNANTNENDDYNFANNWTSTNYNSRITPNRGCSAVPIVPLQPSRATAQAAINAMAPTLVTSYTHSNLGLSWAWRVLSPNWRGQWQTPSNSALPGDYQLDLRDKVVVLLTDGRNTFGTEAASNSNNDYNYLSAYTSFGHLEQNRLGTETSQSTAITNLNSRVTRLCNAMKAQGIIIYAILLQENDATTQSVFQNCVTEPDYFFLSPTAADLNAIFTTIGNQLRRLRISR